jgi:hypothetical protein
MGAHINKEGLFQSDKYPTTPAGKVPLSVKDPTAQDLLWEYAQRRRSVDAEFSADLETCLRNAGYSKEDPRETDLKQGLRQLTIGQLRRLQSHLNRGLPILLDRDQEGRPCYSSPNLCCPLVIAIGLEPDLLPKMWSASEINSRQDLAKAVIDLIQEKAIGENPTQ